MMPCTCACNARLRDRLKALYWKQTLLEQGLREFAGLVKQKDLEPYVLESSCSAGMTMVWFEDKVDHCRANEEADTAFGNVL